MNPHRFFLRTQSLLPDTLAATLTPFGVHWSAFDIDRPLPLDVEVRNAGWHFMWLTGGYSRTGMARTAEAAVFKATNSALRKVKARFNAAELETVDISSHLGFRVAKVRLCERHIQEDASLSLIDEITQRNLRRV